MGKRIVQLIWLVGLLSSLLSCRSLEIGAGDPGNSGSDGITPTPEEGRGGENNAASDITNQWAIAAEASSEFSDPEWSAEQAVGVPDSPGCGDYQFAWASAASDSIDTLTLEYAKPVVPLGIIVHQSFNPDQVVKVEVFDELTGGFYTVLQQNPTRIGRPCPYELVITIDNIDFLTSRIRITVDQSQLGLGWNEIDAVLLVGTEDQP